MKLITLLLENGEAIAILKAYVGQFLADSIRETVTRIDLYHTSAFDRIREKADITAVIVLYDDDTDDVIFVPYLMEEGRNQMVNLYTSPPGTCIW